MRNKKLVVNLLSIGGIGILVGGPLFILIYLIAYGNGEITKDNIANKDPLNSSDNNLERDDRTNITALTLPVEIRRGDRPPIPNEKVSKGQELVSTDYIRVPVPSGPTCSDLANKIQKSYTNWYNQGKIPVRVQFYGTDNYYSVLLKSVEKGEDKDNVYISRRYGEYGEETENTYKVFPIVVCRMRNASFVEYRPTGIRHCRDIEVTYDFVRNSLGYDVMWSGNCDESR